MRILSNDASNNSKQPITSDPILEVQSISKSYPGVQALKEVSFEVGKGEVYGIVGENGAGKTTLLDILSGNTQPDEGQITLKGQKREFETPLEAISHGVNAVHQELSLFPSLTVEENVLIGQGTMDILGFIKTKSRRKKIMELLSTMELEISPQDRVHNLSLELRQQVEILKALSHNPELLLLDEPTSALSKENIRDLFNLIKSLAKEGTSIIFVSHKIHEVMDLCNRVSVLKDGQHVGTVKVTPDLQEENFAKMMTGRKSQELYPSLPSPHSKDERFAIKNLSSHVDNKHLSKVNINVHPGEIIGIAGLVGSGRTELLETLFGLHRLETGEIYLRGEKIRISSPRHALHNGITYIPEDRGKAGLFLDLDISKNLMSNKLSLVSRKGFLDNSLIAENYDRLIKRFNIKAVGPGQVTRFLSGGNQQKTMMARYLAREFEIVMADEPTRGVDIGARADIHHLIRNLTDQGTSVIMVSSEMKELLGMCNRIYVMYEGKIINELTNEEATEEVIMNSILQAAKGGETFV